MRIALGRGLRRPPSAGNPDRAGCRKFPGHIACDAASRSEIVVPLIQQDQLLGVLDVDSPELARFDAEDRMGLEAAANLLLESSELRKLIA